MKLLQAVVFVDEEVFLFEAGDQAIHGVGDGDRDQHQIDIQGETRAGSEFQAVGSGCGRSFGSGGCSGSRRGGCGGYGDMHGIELIVLSAEQVRRSGQQEELRAGVRPDRTGVRAESDLRRWRLQERMRRNLPAKGGFPGGTGCCFGRLRK